MDDKNLDYLKEPVDSDELQPYQRLEIVFHTWLKENNDEKSLHNDN